MIVFPYAKINLGLQITEKRHDGYHNIITCFYPLKWCDVLEVQPAEIFSFKTTGVAIPGSSADNLCVKAYSLLQKDFNLPPVAIHLHKLIPLGAGLGGGSSDASHMVLALRDLFKLSINDEQLMEFARELGSDCAYFLLKGPVIAKGRGDLLEPVALNLPVGFLAVVYPGLNIDTGQAYNSVLPQAPAYDLKQLLLKVPLGNWNQQLTNDFEPSIFKAHPSIKLLRDKLYQLGALYAGLSGSGSSVFGWFKDRPVFDSYFDKLSVWIQPV